MLKHYFKAAFRGILKGGATSYINVLGLSIGMTTAVFIFLWVQNEISFDNYHTGKENIYRITSNTQTDNNGVWVWEGSPGLMAEMALKEIPEIEKAARLQPNEWGSPVFKINNKIVYEKASAFIDKTWFNTFNYDFVAGNASAFGQQPFSIILSQSKAQKYFGNTPAIGQVIKVDTVDYTVRGIIKDNPLNSSLQFDVLMNRDGYLSDPRNMRYNKTWNNFGSITFIQLRPDAKKTIVESKLNELLNNNRKAHNVIVSLQPLGGMYFESDLQSSCMPHGNKKTTYIFCILGILLLLTACINYVNLTTARASLRAKEVGIRKITGAQKSSLFLQFIIESLAVSGLALLLTLLFIQLFLPLFNLVTEKHFQLTLTSAPLWRILLGTLLFATVLNGIYPAVLLSSFKPLNVFRGRSVLTLRDGTVRKGLVVFQFTLSIFLITATIVIYRQLQYIQTTNPGYNISQVASVKIPYDVSVGLDGKGKQALLAGIKHSLQSQSSIAAVSIGGAEIDNVMGGSAGKADWDGHDTTFNPMIALLAVDEDFQKMFQLQLTGGHWFNKASQGSHNYILNETAATELNIHKPIIGQRFIWGEDTGQVIGIVKDFHYKSMHEKIGPMVLTDNQDYSSYIFIKIVPGQIPKALISMAATWAKFIPTRLFEYSFLDDSFNSLYKTDIKTSHLIFIFSTIAVIISAMGLFGLAAFTAEKRTREIGIRKVLGATVAQITRLLSKEFIILVFFAFAIACPLAWWVTNKWLEDFAYRIHLNIWIFAAAGVVAIMVALISVSFQAIKTASANPVKSLRTE